MSAHHKVSPQQLADLKSFDQRDFVGYGPATPRFSWPNGAKIALSFVINYEEGGENTPDNGDPATEVFLNETPGSAPKLNGRDMNMETQYEYGSRCGVHRLNSLFHSRALRYTCFAVGRAVEHNPAVIKQMHDQGNEICSHNYRWIDYHAKGGSGGGSDDNAIATFRKTQAEHCRKAVKAISDATGFAPRGWYTGRIGPDSRAIVLEEYAKLGLELLYDSDAYNDDLPYYVRSPLPNGKPHLVIPYTLDQNDMKFCVPPGFTSGEAFFAYLKDAFDVLYAEGVDGTPKMMSIGLHCRIAGRPGRAAALARFLDYVKGFGQDVWVATREEIALFWKKEFPIASAI
ncbi:hypothetical protein HDU86_005662 [Geranomyces michiganensis]|nr:hypothetical protein HDU86_005662 [Geranomyces michiganensis]